MVCLIRRNSSSHRYFSTIRNPHWQGLRQMTWCSLMRQFSSLGSAHGSHLAQAKTRSPWLSSPVHQSHETKPALQPHLIQINTYLQYSQETLQCLVLYLYPPSGWISVQVLCVSENLPFQYSMFKFTFTPFSLLLSLSFSSWALLPLEVKGTHPSQLVWREGDSQSLSSWHVDKCVGVIPNI